jgi:hypothetical protein
MKEESISGISQKTDNSERREYLENSKRNLIEKFNKLQKEIKGISEELKEVNSMLDELKYPEFVSKYLILRYKNGNMVFAKIGSSFKVLELGYNDYSKDFSIHENFFETSIIKYDIGSKDINQYCVDEEEFYESLRRFLLVNNHQVTKKFEGWGE